MGMKNLFKKKKNKEERICAPCSGRIVQLQDVEDDIFSTGMIGQGFAIRPTNDQIVSPIDGTIITVFHTMHAIGIKTDTGLEVLVHIGLNTVELNGKHFTPFVKAGDRVSVGDLMMKFDREEILKAGYKVDTLVIVSNTDQYKKFTMIMEDEVSGKDEVLQVTA
jgi:PTS system beta-glucosides-specific IIC component